MNNGSHSTCSAHDICRPSLGCQKSPERSLLPCHNHKKRPETLEDTCAQNAMLMNNFVYLQMMLTTLILSIVQPDKEFTVNP